MKIERHSAGSLKMQLYPSEPTDTWSDQYAIHLWTNAKALALADAIYLAAGRLPRVEDDDGYATLGALTDTCDVVWLAGTTTIETKEQWHVLCRLREMGLVETDDITNRYYGKWWRTDRGRAFVAGEGEG